MITRLQKPGLALLAVGALLLGPNQVAAATKHPVPFAAVFSGSAGFSSPTSTTFAGTGLALYLGRITTSGHADLTGSDSSCPGGVANTNTETLTAANGDSLTIVSQDVACPISPGLYHGTGHWTVSGATGRFQDVTGAGSLNGYSDFNAGTFAATLIGSISY